MIEVHCCKSGNGEISEFWVEGHAGWGEPGEDIVCAGVSALAETALLALQKIAKAAMESEQREGHVWCRLLEPKSPESWSKAQTILQSTLLGLKDIQKDYPAYIRVTEGD